MAGWKVWCAGMLLMGTTMPGIGVEARQSRCGVPVNLRVDPSFRVHINDLFSRSETLARQCRTLAAARHVTVFITVPYRLSHDCRARATIHRSASGGMRIFIEIPISTEFPELLAHELEHVVEQIEGINLEKQARVRDTGVRQVGRNIYETERATRAGLMAAREIAGNGGARPVVASVRNADVPFVE